MSNCDRYSCVSTAKYWVKMNGTIMYLCDGHLDEVDNGLHNIKFKRLT